MRKSQHHGKILLPSIDYNLTNVTKLDDKTLFPNNFEKQKLYLVVNLFNENMSCTSTNGNGRYHNICRKRD